MSINQIKGKSGQYLEVDGKNRVLVNLGVEPTEEGKLPVDAQVTAEITDAKVKGSTDAGNTWVPLRVGADGTLEVRINGSIPVIWGATIDDRPAASSVQVGQIFALANAALDMWISNGISWEALE